MTKLIIVLCTLASVAQGARLRGSSAATKDRPPLVINFAELQAEEESNSPLAGKLLKWTSEDYAFYASEKAGKEHYRLLRHVAKQLRPGDTIADIGSRYGTSAFAMASAAAANKVKVNTFDLPDSVEIEASMGGLGIDKDTVERLKAGKEVPNLQFHKKDLLTDEKAFQMVLDADLVMLDTLHLPETTPFEYEFLQKIMDRKFSGVMLLDDINLNGEMRTFWAATKEKASKAGANVRELTRVGHVTGTGMLDFSQRVKILGDDV